MTNTAVVEHERDSTGGTGMDPATEEWRESIM